MTDQATKFLRLRRLVALSCLHRLNKVGQTGRPYPNAFPIDHRDSPASPRSTPLILAPFDSSKISTSDSPGLLC